MSDPKQARVPLEAAERDVTALRGMGDAAVFADLGLMPGERGRS